MKKVFLMAAVMLAATFANAETQITVAEPEFEQEAVLVKSNDSAVPLDIEHAKLKNTENVAQAIFFGAGNQSIYYEIDDPKSDMTLDNSYYEKDLQIVFSWSDNRKSPKRLFQIIPLEIQKNRRIYNVAKYEAFSNAETNEDQGVIKFKAEKYGDHSYLITIPSSELKKIRNKNSVNEVKKFGKQYIIRMIDVTTENLSESDDFITFGIDVPTEAQLNEMKSMPFITKN